MKTFLIYFILSIFIIFIYILTWKYQPFLLEKRISSLDFEIKESSHREDFLYKECKNLDYEISVLS